MNHVKNFKSEFLREEYTYFKHKSGLDVYVFPKKMSTSYALFATKYGSIDNCFKTDKDKDFICVPDGIAHYLEHKMFENENGEDAFVRYAKTGASANAYTSNGMTAYLFSCTDGFNESLEILLDFVTSPYFTKETVEKERGIIAQEIRMYDDHPGSRLYYELLEALYQNHNVKINIAGTVESISKIDAETLYACYNTFYNLNNMALCVCGDIDIGDVEKICDKVLKEAPALTIERKYQNEPREVFHKERSAKLKVAMPLFAIGVKDTDISDDPFERLKKRAVAGIVNIMLFGKTGELYNELYDKGLISEDLHAEYTHNESFSLFTVDGKSNDPDAVFESYLKFTEKVKNEPPSEEDFIIAKRSSLSDFIGIFDSVEDIANEFLSYIFDGSSIFDYADALREVTYADAINYINTMFVPSHTSIAKILPLE